MECGWLAGWREDMDRLEGKKCGLRAEKDGKRRETEGLPQELEM